jgi:FK506-binding protein 1
MVLSESKTHVRSFSSHNLNSMQGVTKVTQVHGDGKTYPKRGQRVTVHYIGELVGGKRFDSSVERGEPFSFTLGMGQVIRGWDDGVAQMSLGEQALLKISPDYGYGARGAPPDIPPNAVLIFQVKLLSIDGFQ